MALPGSMGAVPRGSSEHAPSGLGRLLGGNRLAPNLLGESRHHHRLARRSHALAEGATRDTRDEERRYSNLKHRIDPRDIRTLRIATGIVFATLSCLVAAAAVVVIVWNLGWLWRVAVPLIVAALAAAIAWRAVVCGRQGRSVRPFFYVAGFGISLLTALHAFATTTVSRPAAWLTGLGLACLVVGAVASATWVVERTESVAMASARRRWLRSERTRRAAVDLASADEGAAEYAEEAWLSLVDEEVRLTVAEEGADESWVTEVVDHARSLARPSE